MIDTIVIEAPATRMPQIHEFRVYNIQAGRIRSKCGVLGRGASGPISGTYARHTFRGEGHNILYTCLILPGGRLPRIRLHIPSLPKLRYGHNLWGPATAEEFVRILNQIQADLARQGIRADLMQGTVRRLDICTTLEFTSPIREVVHFLHATVRSRSKSRRHGYDTGIGIYSVRTKLQNYDAVARLQGEIEEFPSLEERNLLRVECQFRNLNQRKGMGRFNTIDGIIRHYSVLRHLLARKFLSAFLQGIEEAGLQNRYNPDEIMAYINANFEKLVRSPIHVIRSVAMETFVAPDQSGYYARKALEFTLKAHGFGSQRKEEYHRTLRWVVLYRALNGSIARPKRSEAAQQILHEIIAKACAFVSEEPSVQDALEADTTSSSSAPSDDDSNVDLMQSEG